MNNNSGGFTETQHESRAIGATLLAFTLATGMEQWTGNGLSVTLTDLTGTLGSSADEASWAITLYGTAFAVSVALTHRLANLLGNRRLMSFACLLYAVTSLGCAESSTLAPFLCFRVLQGFAGGVFLARTLVFITHQYERKDRAGSLRLYGAGFFFIGRLLAPILSGWFADVLSWRLLFVANVPVMLLAAWLFHRYAAPYWSDDIEEQRADILGIALLLVGICSLQTVLSRGEIDDWFGSNRIILLTTIGVACNLLFVAWQFAPRNRGPLLHLAQLRDRGLFSAAVLGAVLGMLLGGSLYVLPQYLRRVESHSALQTGELMSISGVAGIAMLLIVPQLAKVIMKVGGKAVMAFALFVQMLSMAWLGYIITGDTPDRNLWIPLVLNGIFVGISVPSLALAAFIRMEDKHASSARAIYYGARQLGASLGVTAVVVLIDRRATLHSSRLIESLFSRDLSILGVTIDPNNARRVAGIITKQSLVLTFADVFYAMAALAAAMLLFLPLLPSLEATSPAKVDPEGAASLKPFSGHVIESSL
ncbi:MFS transporter [Granulicella tundricola]|uniref:Major facilitator superfamily MFS_1 n=1 Tax=Granulicella tundricola (strain ATCC BAA-1859 / DSM 23138 / MP5ACTX9) TaxID=1198114 RepID=E8X0T4_GRATM|nr:MFS transporter [Granulicella tundricola]ADW70118.1 major facilitator superfamily MFS_1 [Granulicella tundricola MP5ACTX9]